MIMVIMIMMIIGVYFDDDIFATFSELQNKAQNISAEKIKVGIMIGMGVMGIILTAVMGGIYFLLYGLLLRKLKRNYNNLKQLEV